jgi:hypothetical protein
MNGRAFRSMLIYGVLGSGSFGNARRAGGLRRGDHGPSRVPARTKSRTQAEDDPPLHHPLRTDNRLSPRRRRFPPTAEYGDEAEVEGSQEWADKAGYSGGEGS